LEYNSGLLLPADDTGDAWYVEMGNTQEIDYLVSFCFIIHTHVHILNGFHIKKKHSKCGIRMLKPSLFLFSVLKTGDFSSLGSSQNRFHGSLMSRASFKKFCQSSEPTISHSDPSALRRLMVKGWAQLESVHHNKISHRTQQRSCMPQLRPNKAKYTSK